MSVDTLTIVVLIAVTVIAAVVLVGDIRTSIRRRRCRREQRP
jgi:hypothetical protein